MTWQVGDTIEEDVIIYDGYDEEASRLVFHYSDHFANLEGSIEQRTFLPSGVSENEPKKLPIKPEDEAPDKVCVTCRCRSKSGPWQRVRLRCMPCSISLVLLAVQG